MKKIIFFLIFLTCQAAAWAIELPFIDKSKIRLNVEPGEAVYGEIMVENRANEDRAMRVYLNDWHYLPAHDGSKEFLPAGTTALSCANWVSFSPAEFTLAPFSRQKVSYAIKAPLDAKGGFYAALFFESIFGRAQMQQPDFKAGMNLAVRIAVLFYLEIEGAAQRSGEISNLRLEKIKDSKSESFQLDFSNTGNSDIAAGGIYHIIDQAGIVLARGEFSPVYTFAQETASLSAPFEARLAKGSYDLIFTIDLGKAQEEAGLGRGPLITKETNIEIGEKGEVINLGKLN
jgi:hypothetical protein